MTMMEKPFSEQELIAFAAISEKSGISAAIQTIKAIRAAKSENELRRNIAETVFRVRGDVK